MKDYQVTWTIDVYAAGPREAAQIALDIQRDPQSCATCFEVTDPTAPMTISIDLGSS